MLAEAAIGRFMKFVSIGIITGFDRCIVIGPRYNSALVLGLPSWILRFSKLFLFLTCCAPGWAQVITSIAGTDWLFPGDGSLAINAPLGGSVGLGVATGPAGSFYIADADNQMVMSVGADGVLHVIAGNGFVGH